MNHVTMYAFQYSNPSSSFYLTKTMIQIKHIIKNKYERNRLSKKTYRVIHPKQIFHLRTLKNIIIHLLVMGGVYRMSQSISLVLEHTRDFILCSFDREFSALHNCYLDFSKSFILLAKNLKDEDLLNCRSCDFRVFPKRL